LETLLEQRKVTGSLKAFILLVLQKPQFYQSLSLLIQWYLCPLACMAKTVIIS